MNKIINESGKNKKKEKKEFFDLQTDYESNIMKIIYARDLTKLLFHIVIRKVEFRKVSET